MEIVRRLDPEVADRLAVQIGEALDDGGVASELLFEWRQGLADGVPVSAPRSYRTLFDEALGESVPR